MKDYLNARHYGSSSKGSPLLVISAVLALLFLMLSASSGYLRPSFAQVSPLTSSPVSFGTKINLSSDSGASKVPVVASSGNNVYVAWLDDSQTPGSAKVFFRASHNAGATFDPVIRFLNPGTALAVRIYAEGSNVYIVWQQKGFVYFAASADNGTTFKNGGNPSVLSTTGSGQPVVGASGSSVYVAWVFTDSATGSKSIIFRASHDAGSTFGPTQSLGTGREEELTAIGSYVYVIWTLPPVQIRVSHDGGATFDPVIRLSQPATCSPNLLSREPKMAAYGNNVYVTWTTNSPGNYEAFIAVSQNHGAAGSWTCHNLSNDPASSREVEVAAYGNNVYAVFRDNSGGRVDEYIAISNDGGTNFSPKVDLSNNKGGQNGFGQVAAYGDGAYVIWPDSASGHSQIYFRSSQDAGATFARTQNLSNSSGTALALNDPGDEGDIISVFGTHIYAVWQDSSTGNDEVFFRSSA